MVLGSIFIKWRSLVLKVIIDIWYNGGTSYQFLSRLDFFYRGLWDYIPNIDFCIESHNRRSSNCVVDRKRTFCGYRCLYATMLWTLISCFVESYQFYLVISSSFWLSPCFCQFLGFLLWIAMLSPAFVGLLMLGELTNVPFPSGLQLASQLISYERTINSVCVIKILCVMHWDIPYFMDMKSLKRT